LEKNISKDYFVDGNGLFINSDSTESEKNNNENVEYLITRLSIFFDFDVR
jgi:hypothetical protein